MGYIKIITPSSSSVNTTHSPTVPTSRQANPPNFDYVISRKKEEDIQETFSELEVVTTPKKVRKLLNDFIVFTSQLTGVMYKEYKGLTGEDWKATSFKGWNTIKLIIANQK